MNKKEKIAHYLRLGIYILIHLGALAAIFTGVSLASVIICLALFVINIWAVGAGYHRYFSHKSYSTSRVFQFILAVLAQAATQKGVLWWSNNHREHHSFSDTPQDLHSPRQSGFWYAHTGWIFEQHNNKHEYTTVKDLQRYPELVWLDKHDMLPTIVLAVIIFLIAGWSGLAIGFCLSRVLVWHTTYTINSLSHKYGKQRYNTGDDSRNNFWLALITFGEGWHNNHHHYASSARQGFFWWEIDLTYYSLKFLSLFGVVWDIKVPPKEVREDIKPVSPGARIRSQALVSHNVADLPQISNNLLGFTQQLNQQSCLDAKYNSEDLRVNTQSFITSLSKNIPQLKKLPPKLAENVKNHISQAIFALHALLEAINSGSKDKISNIVKTLENAAQQLRSYIPDNQPTKMAIN